MLPVPMRMLCLAFARGQAEALLGFEVGDVGVAAVVLDAEDAAAIAGEGEQAIGARGEGVDDLVFAGPELARGLAFVESVDLGSFGQGGAGVGCLAASRAGRW